jgi:hypothetical protein
LRRHVGDVPDVTPVALSDGHEAAQLASHMVGRSCHTLGLPADRFGYKHFAEPTLLPDVSPEDMKAKWKTASGKLKSPTIIIRHVIKAQKVLAKYEPVEDRVSAIANALSEAMNEICDIVLDADHRFFYLTLHMMLTDYYDKPLRGWRSPKLHELIPYSMFAKPKNLQAIISLSSYRYMIRQDEDVDSALHILGYFTEEERDEQIKLFQAWLGEVHIPDWARPDGRRWTVVLGWAFSSYAAER